jgi:hypothetical protein
MRTTSASRDALGNTRLSNPHLSQAREREHFQFDFRIEMELIGAELRRLRKEKGLSIESVAKAARMPKFRLCKIEHGMYIHFGLELLYGLSALYGVSPLEVLSVIPDARFEDL